jgi:hypothetical protein
MEFQIHKLPNVAAGDSAIEIPMNLLRPCLRDARAHGSIFEVTPKFWLLYIPVDVDGQNLHLLQERYFTPVETLLESVMHLKAQNGGKETFKARQEWYFHPSAYFKTTKGEFGFKPPDLTGHVWTFNRYGLWRRSNIAVHSKQAVTGNHGCYTYYLTAPYLQDRAEEIWELLVAWFNSTWYLGTLFQHAKIPAKHVQQVNLTEHRQMLVPKFRELIEAGDAGQNIRHCLQDLHNWLEGHPEECLPDQMRACSNNPTHPRVMLDGAWAKFLDLDFEEFWAQFRQIYAQFEELILAR